MSLHTITPEAIEKARQGFKDRGESMMSYAKKHKLDYNSLQMVLQGRSKGVRGQAHKCMVALGLKKEVKHG